MGRNGHCGDSSSEYGVGDQQRAVGTRQAVDQVSEFYLEELAGRRAEVVTDELKTHFTYMENALGILEDRDLESQESLRRFLGRIKKLY